jgi:hypothetical protein
MDGRLAGLSWYINEISSGMRCQLSSRRAGAERIVLAV